MLWMMRGLSLMNSVSVRIFGELEGMMMYDAFLRRLLFM